MINIVVSILQKSLLTVLLIVLFFNCYTKIKTAENKQSRNHNPPLITEIQDERKEEIKFKYLPEEYSDIQIKYYWYDEKRVRFINQINFNGYLDRIFLDKDLSNLNDEFQIESKIYSILLEHFEQSGFLAYPQLLPQTNQLRWPSHGVVIFYRFSKEDKFKGVKVDLTADDKYYPKGFYKLFNKLLETSKDPRYKPN